MYALASTEYCNTVAESCHQTHCSGRFESVRIYPRVNATTVVAWQFVSAGLTTPVQFRLEFSENPSNLSDAWQPVSDWQEDIVAAEDNKRRSHGFLRLAYYRVAAIDGDNQVIYSDPISAVQAFDNQRHARNFANIVRMERKRARMASSPMLEGYLLKVRYYGEICTRCADPNNNMPTQSDCSECFGIGYRLGYHYPVPCFSVDLSNNSYDLKMYTGQPPGVAGNQMSMRYLNVPEVHPWDIWVHKSSDLRYMIGGIENLTTVGAYPVVCRAAVAQLAFDHPVYRVPVHYEDDPHMFFAQVY